MGEQNSGASSGGGLSERLSRLKADLQALQVADQEAVVDQERQQQEAAAAAVAAAEAQRVKAITGLQDRLDQEVRDIQKVMGTLQDRLDRADQTVKALWALGRFRSADATALGKLQAGLDAAALTWRMAKLR